MSDPELFNFSREPTGTPRRIVVLGGGLGSLAAVYALTCAPDWQQRFEITVYQIGWRLGGKARSGRNMRAQRRSEAFGSHVWWGCYDQAFAMLRRCYKELARPVGTPLATFREAWRACDVLHIGTGTDEQARLWPLALARNDVSPGEGPAPPRVWDYVQVLLTWVLDCLPALHPDLPDYATLATRWNDQARALLPALLRRARNQGLTVFAGFDPQAPDYDALLRHLGGRIPEGPLSSRQRRAWAQPLVVGAEQSLRVLESAGTHALHPNFFPLVDLALAVVRGIINDGIDRNPAGFSAIDDHELRGWLRHHGASAASLSSPVVAGFYDLLYAYQDGDPTRPNLAAGAGLRLLLRSLLGHRGSLYYSPQADLGEVVFVPLYQLLRRRGVRFRFFHKVKQVDGNDEAITAIRIGRQVEFDPGIDDYEPLVTVHGSQCWPSRPAYAQIVLGESPLIQALDFESQDSPEVEEFTLRHGQDFDAVILGIPAPVLPRVCSNLMHLQPRWSDALIHSTSIATVGAQAWLLPTWAQLSGHATGTHAGSLPGTHLPRFGNRSVIIPLEHWPRQGRPGAVLSLSGALPEAAPELSREGLRDYVAAWFRDHPRRLWPEAALSATRELNWELLADPQDRTGEYRLAGQHLWLLTNPSDRFTQTPPGAPSKRLRPDASGFKNLVLAGDWLTGGLDLGCAESAVIAGLQAARALAGEDWQIPGEHDGVDMDQSPSASQSLAVPLSL